MYSLAQKRMMAKRDGKDEVVLTMDEAEATLANLSELDKVITEWMEYVPDEIVDKFINCQDCNKHPYECECEFDLENDNDS